MNLIGHVSNSKSILLDWAEMCVKCFSCLFVCVCSPLLWNISQRIWVWSDDMLAYQHITRKQTRWQPVILVRHYVLYSETAFYHILFMWSSYIYVCWREEKNTSESNVNRIKIEEDNTKATSIILLLVEPSRRLDSQQMRLYSIKMFLWDAAGEQNMNTH